MFVGRRGIITPLIVLLMLLGTLGQPALASAQFVQPDATETAPAEPTSAPVETEVPATDVPPTEVPATDVPPTVESTATDVPVEDPDIGAADIYELAVSFEECQDTDRVGDTDFFFDGEIAAAAVGSDCVVTNQVAGMDLQVTIDDGGSGSYSEPLDSNGRAYFYGGVEEGSYTVTVSNGAGYSATLQGQIVLEQDGEYDLRIVHYVTGEQTAPSDSGGADVYGSVAVCRDPERVGQIDVLFEPYVPAFDAAADICTYPDEGQVDLQFIGTPLGETTDSFSVPIQGDDFSAFVPYGTYRVVDNITGIESADIQIGSDGATTYDVSVYLYSEDAPQFLPTLFAGKTVCAVPEGDDRAGSTEFVIIEDGGFNASATCYTVNETFDPPITVTLLQGGQAVDTEDISSTYQLINFPSLTPGTYTLSEDVPGEGPNPVSDPFTLENGDQTYIQIVNYVAGGDGGEPDLNFYSAFYGAVVYCTSPELAGTVDFQIFRQDGGENVAAQGTSLCRYATAGEGEAFVRVFETPEGGEPQVIDEIPLDIGPGGYFQGYYYSNSINPTSYQVVFRTGSFDQEFTSDVFSAPNDFGSATNIGIIAYVAPSDDASDITILKQLCYDPARNGETDFFVNERPAPDDDGGIPLAAAATTECRYPDVDGTIVWTLTNTESGDQATFTTSSGSGYGLGLAFFTNVPAGTYTLTEDATLDDPDDEGDATIVYNATSAPFTLSAPYYEVAVKNYTDDEEPDGFSEFTYDFGLDAFTCDDPARTGEFEYFYEGYSGDSLSIAAAATSECVLSAPGEYAFVLDGPIESGDDGSEVAAQAIYPLEPTGDPDDFQFVYAANDGVESLPSGTYVIRELVTGSESEPIVLDETEYTAEFYYYAAAPTPTPTLEPGVTPTVDPTRIVANPPVDIDGDGDPDPTDPDDDNDGTPDAEADGDNGGGVTALPSTGQGGQDTGASLALITLAGALVLLAIAGLQAQRARR